jgi:DNA-directed RNA polymerase subunit beta
MNKVFVNNISELNELQRSSYLNFLFNDIKIQLKNFPKSFNSRIFLNKKYKSVYFKTNFNFDKIKYQGPENTINKCLIDKKTFSIKIYIEAKYLFYLKLRSKNSKKIYTIKKNILFGEIPLMTQDGLFIIDGYPRVIISQIIRSPGVFFNKEVNLTKKNSYSSTIISDKGFWLKFILEETYNINKEKVEYIYLELDNLGSFKSILTERYEHLILDKNKILLGDLLNLIGLELPIINLREKYNLNCKLMLYKNDNKFIKNKILQKNKNFNLFSIGLLGRYKVNRSLGLNLSKDLTYLTEKDFSSIIDNLYELKYKNRNSDDIDHIKNKQIRSVGHFLEKQLRLSLQKIQKNIEETSIHRKNVSNKNIKRFLIKNVNKINNIFDEKILMNSFKEFFKISELSQFLDQTNPLSEQTHKAKVSVFGPNGVSRDNVSTKIRDIHPSQYNRFCSVETPEGQSSGLTSSITLFNKINSLGSLEAPYFIIQKNKILNNKNPIFLSPEQEHKVNIMFPDIILDNNSHINSKYVLVKKNYSFFKKNINITNFISTSPLQVMSLSASLIPFMEHNDANRILMGTSMQKQAVPLIYSQKPLIGTNFESISLLSSNMVLKSYCEGIVVSSSTSFIQIKDDLGQNIFYYLQKYMKSNQDTALNNRPIVWNGEKIYSGQIIADASSSQDGELALGKNLTIAYMPWEGYNYEDAILINERLVYNNILTSILIEEIETTINLSDDSFEGDIVIKDVLNKNKYAFRNLDSQGIVKIGSYVKPNDALISRLNMIKAESTYLSKLMKAIDYHGEEEYDFDDKSLYVPSNCSGRVIDIRMVKNTKENVGDNEQNIVVVRIYIASIKKIGVGDKLSGRHGNKGIISKVLSKNDMPNLPDGTPVDIILNPLGVPSRMNVGQLFECLFGLASENIGSRFKINPFDELYGKEASRILVTQKLKEAAIKSKKKWIFNPNFPGKVLLKDGRTGEYFDNPVTIGKSYILKLIHLVDSKIHARSIGPYTTNMQQPVAGKTQQGGQRFGEMEVWALEAYGCSNTLQEMLTIKSDDIEGRSDMYNSIKNNLEKPEVSISDSFLSLIREFNSLGLDFSLKKYHNNFNSVVNSKISELNIFDSLETRLKLRNLFLNKNLI